MGYDMKWIKRIILGLIISGILLAGYIRWERMGNVLQSDDISFSPDRRYFASSAVGCVRDFWGNWKDYYCFSIYQVGIKKPTTYIRIDEIEPFDTWPFFPDGIGEGVRRLGSYGEDWTTTWSSDSSEVTFSIQNIELKLKVNKDSK